MHKTIYLSCIVCVLLNIFLSNKGVSERTIQSDSVDYVSQENVAHDFQEHEVVIYRNAFCLAAKQNLDGDQIRNTMEAPVTSSRFHRKRKALERMKRVTITNRQQVEKQLKKNFSEDVVAFLKGYGRITGVGVRGDGAVSVLLVELYHKKRGFIYFAVQTRGVHSDYHIQNEFYQITPENTPRVYYQEDARTGGLGEPYETIVMDVAFGNNLFDEFVRYYYPEHHEEKSILTEKLLKNILYKSGRVVGKWHSNGLFHNDFGLGHIYCDEDEPVVIDYDLSVRAYGGDIHYFGDIDQMLFHIEKYAARGGGEHVRMLKNLFLEGYRSVHRDNHIEDRIIGREFNSVTILQKTPEMAVSCYVDHLSFNDQLALLKDFNRRLKLEGIDYVVKFTVRGSRKAIELVPRNEDFDEECYMSA